MKLLRPVLWVILIAIALTLGIGFYYFDWQIDGTLTGLLLGLVGVLSIALLGFLLADIYLHVHSDKNHLKRVRGEKNDSQDSPKPKKVVSEAVQPAKTGKTSAKAKKLPLVWQIIRVVLVLALLTGGVMITHWFLSRDWIDPKPHHIVSSVSDTAFSVTKVQVGPPKVLETASATVHSAPTECTQPAFTATATKTVRAEAPIPLHCHLIVDGLSVDERNKLFDRSCQDRTGTWYDPGLNECVNDNGAGYQLKEDSEVESREVHFTYKTIK